MVVAVVDKENGERRFRKSKIQAVQFLKLETQEQLPQYNRLQLKGIFLRLQFQKFKIQK